MPYIKSVGGGGHRPTVSKDERLAGFIRTLREQTEPVAEFDERLWGCMVDYVTVDADSGMTVVFRDGTGI